MLNLLIQQELHHIELLAESCHALGLLLIAGSSLAEPRLQLRHRPNVSSSEV